MTQKFANAARAYLASTVSDSATTVVIDGGGSLFPAITSPDFSRAVLQDGNGIEVVLITAHTAASDSFTVTRGQEGTTARSFATGSVFGIRVTAADMDEAMGAGGLTYALKTANYTAVDKEGVLADTSGGAFTVTLPATPSVGAQVVIADAGNAWGTNNLTVARNGSTISGLAENLICDITGASVQFVYDGTTWEVYAQIGGQSGTVLTLDGTQTLTNKTISGTNNTITGISLTTAVTGTLPIANGGTGQTTRQAAMDALAGAVTSGQYLRGDGTDVVMSAIQAADVPTLNQNTTGTAGNVTGTVAVANGGTGQTTRQAAMDALAGAVTSGQYLRGDGTDVVMSAIQAADVPTLNQNTTGTAANVTGTVAVANGGTGATSLTANNVILGNGTSAVQTVAPDTTGNVLTSNGTTWTSAPAPAVTPFSNNTVLAQVQATALCF
jgi:hypothetical protein